jgi:hypothetical protein
MSWDLLKAESVVYPAEKFPFPPENNHWFHRSIQLPFRELVMQFPNGIYLELGSFLGAGTTRCVIENVPGMRLICCDNFAMTSDYFRTRHVEHRDSPFYTGQGTCFQHFINNTFEARERVALLHCDTSEALAAVRRLNIAPDVILIDATHTEDSVFSDLSFCAIHFPHAMILLDDYCPSWPGVKKAVVKAESRALLKGRVQKLKGDRLLVLEGLSV